MLIKSIKWLVLAGIIGIGGYTIIATAGEFISTDHKLTYVKLENLTKKERQRAKLNHPFPFTDPQMRAILSSLKLNRAFMIKQEIEVENVFTDRAIEYLTPRLVEAFRKVTPTQKIVISYVSKDPEFFIRRDYLHIVNAWVDGEGFHVEFDKLWARLSGDTDKRGYTAKSVANSRGGRIGLELGPRQTFGSSTREVILDVNYDYAQGKIMAAPDEISQVGIVKKKTVKQESKKEDVTTPAPAPELSTKEKLQELEELKSSGLITEQEYEAKRKAILTRL